MTDELYGFQIGDRAVYTAVLPNSWLTRKGDIVEIVGTGEASWGPNQNRVHVRFPDGYETRGVRVGNLERIITTPSTHTRWQR